MENNICPFCNNSGWEFTSAERSTVRECRCGIRKRMIMQGRLAFANIPDAFQNISIRDFDTEIYSEEKSKEKARVVYKSISYWLDNFDEMKSRGMGLYFYSSKRGSGKTRLATGIANELLNKKGLQVKFCTSIQILNEIKNSWDRKSTESESDLIEQLSSVEILVIDDFGTEQSDKPWINERFYSLINSRYIDKRVTIFTSNSPLEALKYDDRIVNRIKERVFAIPFPEESVRDIIAKENMRELIKELKGGD